MRADTLTREQIVTAAIALLDAEGLEGLNMRALGARLGAAPTAVYWHLGGKDDIVALAGDRLWQEIPLPSLDGGWRPAATALAVALYGQITRHPWLLAAFGSFMMYGPGKARYDEHSLAVYEAAGFAGLRAEQAATAVLTYVLGNALGATAAGRLARKLEREGERGEARLRASLARARDVAAAYPRLRTWLDSAPAEYVASPEESFELGLQALVDGLESRLAAHSTPAQGAAATGTT